ncbi:hypothetical protein LCGC14_0844180 [marine sediment metagenome]|uniref:Uncharacterized protein n=1 Tax=marine sediment metagenome TaxID=412755 RepID=A0A0F9SJD5_9ZZZZ
MSYLINVWMLGITIAEYLRKQNMYSYVHYFLGFSLLFYQFMMKPSSEGLGAIVFVLLLAILGSMKSYKKINLSETTVKKKKIQKIIFWSLVGLVTLTIIIFLIWFISI